MPRGIIKKLVPDRGFGFISADGGDIFFHHSSVADGMFDNLHEGQEVEYEMDEGEQRGGKGPRASRVTAAS